MAAMHWEARRKQCIIDKKCEYRRKLRIKENKEREPYSEIDIRRVAEEVSRDIATPLSAMMRRSRVQLSSRGNSCFCSDYWEHPEALRRQKALNRKYSAKIANRYSSTNYIQQH